MTSKALYLISLSASLILAASAFAQVPVIDSATLTQATQTAQQTAQIMQTNQQILQYTQATYNAVTGNRTTGSLSSIGLGSGFSMSSVPGLSSLLGGGGISMGGLGSYGSLASSIINGLNLVRTLTGQTSTTSPTDQAYTGAVNTAAAITAAVAGGQAAQQTRSSAFQSAGGQVGSAPDVKGSIDQNSQLQTQTGQTINELIGTVTLTNAALNAQQQQDLAAQSKLSTMWTYDASRATLTGN
ncbi:MAG: type VI secretion protein [Hyphomicrobiales bacterium]|nr:type VI secretion protein [Hyphomicrobiales bacterium]